MSLPTERFITRMKLHELRRQRDRLRAAYDDLQQQLADAGDDGERFQSLYEGLQGLKFANQPLHPDVANLDVLLHELETGRADSGSVAYWIESLTRHLDIGRQRSEFVYLFGALLEEWTQAAEATEESLERVQKMREEVDRLRDRAPSAPYAEFLEPLLAPLLDWADFDPEAEGLRRTMDGHYLEQLLMRIRDNNFRPAHVRHQAGRFVNDQQLLNEFADALTIMIDNLDVWTWPEDGVQAVVRMVGGRWRLFLDEDLPTAALLEALGDRWLMHYHYLISDAPHETGPGDAFWAAAEGEELGKTGGRVWGDLTSIVGHRNRMHDNLRHAIWQVNYSREGYSGGLELSARLVNAELRLWQAVFPERPLYVVKVDLQDFYPSLSHEILLWMLEKAGIPEEDRAIIAHFLPVRLQVDAEIVEARRGLPNDRTLSHALGELVLRRLDEYVSQVAPVQIIRVVDDITVLASSAEDALAAWEAIQTFCEATGLRVNEAKSGSVCIGAERPEGLPENWPTWKLLQLHDDGEWGIDREALDSRQARARDEVDAAPSAIATVEAYNTNLREVLDDLALNVWLGDAHRERTGEALADFHYRFAGDQSIADVVRDMLRTRFFDGDHAVDIPEAWLYWPLTAGGLGLLHPMIEVVSRAETINRDQYLRMDPPDPAERRADWQEKSNDWAGYYQRVAREVKPAPLKRTQMMEAMVKDFIQRGTEMSGEHQRTLSAYWRWVLYTYGPQIIDRFGSFRFLITELVPLQLILQSRRRGIGSTSEGDDEPIPF